MKDDGIVALYWARSERAIRETEAKYGRYCYAIAWNILSSAQDAEESANDTYLAAWEAMPPHRPAALSTFLGKLTRRIALNRRKARRADKRGGDTVALALEELDEFFPAENDTQAAVEQRELERALHAFLAALPDTERDVFLCRYWYFSSISEISGRLGFSQSKTKSMLLRTRRRLRGALQKEGLI